MVYQQDQDWDTDYEERHPPAQIFPPSYFKQIVDNGEDYAQWKMESAKRARRVSNRWNIYQDRVQDRSWLHSQYKYLQQFEIKTTKETIQKRIDNACSCTVCCSALREWPGKLSPTSCSSTPNRVRQEPRLQAANHLDQATSNHLVKQDMGASQSSNAPLSQHQSDRIIENKQDETRDYEKPNDSQYPKFKRGVKGQNTSKNNEERRSYTTYLQRSICTRYSHRSPKLVFPRCSDSKA